MLGCHGPLRGFYGANEVSLEPWGGRSWATEPSRAISFPAAYGHDPLICITFDPQMPTGPPLQARVTHTPGTIEFGCFYEFQSPRRSRNFVLLQVPYSRYSTDIQDHNRDLSQFTQRNKAHRGKRGILRSLYIRIW